MIDPERKSGRNKHRRIHWGTVDDDMRFHPNSNYIMASPEERAKLIFPEDWDMSEARSLPSERKAGRPSTEEDNNRLYGDTWLLEQVAAKTGMKDMYHGIKEEFLQSYLDEFCYKFNRMYFGDRTFDRLVVAAVAYKPTFKHRPYNSSPLCG